MSSIITIEVIDTHESYGFEGKVVAKSDVRGKTDMEIIEEAESLMVDYPTNVYSYRYVEEVGAA